MLVKLEFDDHPNSIEVDWPVIPNVGDEVTLDYEGLEEYLFYRVESKDFRIVNDKLVLIILYLEEL